MNILNNEFYVEPLLINTDKFSEPEYSDNLNTARNKIFKVDKTEDSVEVSIYLQAYNRLEKTKLAIKSLLDNTKDINYELILVDNGSSDGTYEYFQSVPYKNKKIIKVSKNIGTAFPNKYIHQLYTSNILVGISNDVYVTKNWLSNILKCINSDDSIGLVCPLSTNVSNLQQPLDFEFSDYYDLQEKAAEYNISDPKKWEERIRLVTVLPVFRREALHLTGNFDFGYYHDFMEDDWCIRLRRAGFKLMLCGDVIVHHDHIYDTSNINLNSIESGRANYKSKFYGIDAWDDALNFEKNLISLLDSSDINLDYRPKILGIDVKMGTPILELKNLLRRNNCFSCDCSAFTTDAKYYLDLQTICNDEVYCDRIQYIWEKFSPNSFDYIILGHPINMYSDPIEIFQKILELLKPGGFLLLKLRNAFDFRNLLNTLGHKNNFDQDMPSAIPVNEFIGCFDSLSLRDYKISADMHILNEKDLDLLKMSLINTNLVNNIQNTINELCVKDYLICINK